MFACGARPTQEPDPQAADERAISNIPVVAPVETPPAPAPTPIVTPASVAAHTAVQSKAVGGPLPEQPLAKFMPIEDVSGEALASFHAALRKLAAGEDNDGKVRVAVYGSSSVAADRYTGYLRGYLQHRFGDGGIGYVAAVPLWRWHRHNEVAVKASKGWSVEHGQKKVIREGGHLGLLGASAIASRKRVSTTIGPASREWYSPFAETSKVELHYLRQPAGGRFEIAIGNGKPTTVVTRAKTTELGIATPKVATPLDPITIKLRGDGEVRLFGAVLEREEPGVVVDALGVGGTRAHLGARAHVRAPLRAGRRARPRAPRARPRAVRSGAPRASRARTRRSRPRRPRPKGHDRASPATVRCAGACARRRTRTRARA